MNILILLVVVGMLATLGVLITGVSSMAHGGDFDRRHADQLMAARVGLQGLTLLLLLVALYLAAR